jgi:hypothetical protein
MNFVLRNTNAPDTNICPKIVHSNFSIRGQVDCCFSIIHFFFAKQTKCKLSRSPHRPSPRWIMSQPRSYLASNFPTFSKQNRKQIVPILFALHNLPCLVSQIELPCAWCQLLCQPPEKNLTCIKGNNHIYHSIFVYALPKKSYQLK